MKHWSWRRVSKKSICVWSSKGKNGRM